jgi:hypothetical protein
MTGLFLIRTVIHIHVLIDLEHVFVRSVPNAEAHRSPLYLCALVRLRPDSQPGEIRAGDDRLLIRLGIARPGSFGARLELQGRAVLRQCRAAGADRRSPNRSANSSRYSTIQRHIPECSHERHLELSMHVAKGFVGPLPRHAGSV